MIELWKMSQGGSASALERQWVDRIGTAAGRLARTVEKMLKLVRNREFSQAVDAESIDLEPLVRQAIDDLAPYLELRGQAVSVSVEPNLGPIEVDFFEDLRCAAEFAGQRGQVHSRWRHHPGRTAEPSVGDWVRVSIRDQGVGVAPDDQQHLFEPFFTGFDTLRHSSGDYQFGKRASVWDSGWSRRSSSCTAGAVRGFQHAGRGLDVFVPPASIASRCNAWNLGPASDPARERYA